MNRCAHTMVKNVAALIVSAAGMSALAPLKADPLPVEKKTNAPGRSATTAQAWKPPTGDYAAGGNSVTGSHLPMPVLKDRGHYYVNSAFSARQVTLYTNATSGLGTRAVNVDEVSNLPANRSKNGQEKKKQYPHQLTANNGNR